MNIEKLLSKIRDTKEVINQAERLLAREKHEGFYISSSNGPCVYIHNDELTPLIRNKIEGLTEKLKVLLDAQLTAERVIAGLLPTE
ncbi:TPA: hypothetical protein ACUU9M_000002 [Yersinia enterocolitica]|nr:hypothetical protein [Yersinia enterocolitica]HEB0969561.1 hypothetical protein [Yersinia enterocolitica]HEB1846614.1 hypothetical protein [Yersinia enterocolitica]HEG7100204.1 hypothetical protein [Yersinia enterocolitica]HEK7319421.1 hypothetical protein [Yersinia enterocolitica]